MHYALCGNEGTVAESIQEKLDAVLAKNEGLETLRQINAVLCGDDKQRIDGFSFTPEEVAAFKYAPLVSCDVERSFSKYRAVFRDNRRAFHAETLKIHLIIYCNP
jgi:hypothetical protein